MLSCEKTDEYFTPPYAIDIILPYIPQGEIILEAATGTGNMADYLEQMGYTVKRCYDFFNYGNDGNDDYDIIITNPPYSIKTKFLQHAYKIGKPFAFLLPITALEGIARGILWRKYGIQLIIPDKRINYANGSKNVYFNSSWFCWNLLPQDMIFVKLERDK